MTLEEALEDLKTADLLIKKSNRYVCGLEGGFERKENDDTEWLRLFFSSPDYQNDSLFFTLANMGWAESMYNAPYHWEVKKNGIYIRYTEGDIDIVKGKEKI